MGSRHQKNDDLALLNQEQGIYVICDGVSEGGHGDLASNMVAKVIQDKLMAANSFIKKNGAQLLGAKRLLHMQEQMVSACTEAQQNIQKAALQNPNYKFAATTGIILWLDGRFGILAHMGDSRAYLYRAGKLYQLTHDHAGIDELLKMGIPLEIAKKNPQAKCLTKVFGGTVFNQPDLLKIEFQPNDVFMMCTDGVYSTLDPNNLQQLVQGMLQKNDAKPIIERCARQSGDDSTFVQIHFPIDMLQETVVQASDRIKLIQQTPLSKYFDYIQKSHISAICEVESFKAGSIVIQDGTEGECLYIVAKGTLEVLVQGSHMLYKKPGEFLGEVALIQQSKRTATVVAKEDTVLLSLKRGDLNEVFKKSPDIERNFYKAMLEMVLERMVAQGYEIAQLKKV